MYRHSMSKAADGGGPRPQVTRSGVERQRARPGKRSGVSRGPAVALQVQFESKI